MVRKKKDRFVRKKRLWSESIDYLKDTKEYIYISVMIFFVAAFVTFVFPDYFTFFDAFLREVFDKTKGLGFFELLWFIFQNNTMTSFVAMILGICFGVVPIFIALINGAILGYVFALTVAIDGFSSVIYILPHGIFELPAVFISLGLGIRFGMFIFAKKIKEEFWKRFNGSIRVFFTIVIPLLIIAAIIESFLIVTKV